MASASMQSEPRKGPTPRRFTVIRGVGSGAPPRVRQPPISNTQVAVLVLIAFETMMFVGLVTAYLVLRTGSFAWPPPDLPRLPIAVTWVNTGVLLFSAVTMRRALSATTAGNQAAMRAALTATAVLGIGFLAVQGTEWVQLVRRGLTLSSGAYGATFYTLIGLHALHVLAAVGWLVVVLVLALRGHYSARKHAGVTMCATYWFFVCALWVALFGLVYLY
jgi:heme/copper-type cytochrome/quinol oxidase subunit 3